MNSEFSPEEPLLPRRETASQTESSGEEMLPGTAASESYLPAGEMGEVESVSPQPTSLEVTATAGQSDLQLVLAESTRNGGLAGSVPPEYRNGLWRTILAKENPFEILFLDYRQVATISPETIRGNYETLLQFWEEIIASSSDISRDRNQKKYGAETLDNAEAILAKAFQKLSIAGGPEKEFRQIENRRIANGQALLQEKIDDVIVFGELVPGNLKSILRKGADVGLSEIETEGFLYTQLKEAGFSARHDFGDRWLINRKYEELAELRRAPQVQTQVNGVVVHNKVELGEVLLKNREWALQNYLHNTAYLIGDISKLYNSDEARKAEALLLSESDGERRYLRTVYNLAPELPFQLEGQTFDWVVDLFAATSNDYFLFEAAAASFRKGYLQVWLSETDKEGFEIADRGGNTMLDFLTFVYTVNRDHPFFLKGEAFATPQSLIRKAKSSAPYRSKLSESMERGEIFKWLTALGMHTPLERYNKQVDPFLDNPFYTDAERNKGAVQILIETLDATVSRPLIKTSISELSLLEIEGTELLSYRIECAVPAGGFVKAKISLANAVANAISGVTCGPAVLIFDSDLGMEHQAIIDVRIDPMQLAKGKLYETEISIGTGYEQILIPISLTANLPKKAYWLTVAKYAVIFGVLFGFARLIVDRDNIFPSYFITVGILAEVFIYGWRWIKKMEKIK